MHGVVQTRDSSCHQSAKVHAIECEDASACCVLHAYLKQVSHYPSSSPKGSGPNLSARLGEEEQEQEQEQERDTRRGADGCSPLCRNGPSKGKARRAFQSQPIGQSLLQAVVDATSLVPKPGISREPGLCGTSALSDCSCWCA